MKHKSFMKKLAIVGANDFQNQLILKAKEMGLETHVFAWEDDAVGKANADFFYPISIREKEVILKKCKEIGIEGICSIASDLAVITVNYVAHYMNLNANSIRCSEIATNKYYMRKAFYENGDPIPKFAVVSENDSLDALKINFPLIVKPVDRSGSRGVFKVMDKSKLTTAVIAACAEAFEHKAIVEEFIDGKEYSVECISFHAHHTLLAVTEKLTTGSPHFIETGHNQPALLSDEMRQNVQKVVYHALDSLEIAEGASHSEIKIDDNGEIKIIEIGSRMGGDCIGSDLVHISTGYDFTKMVIQVALNENPNLVKTGELSKAAVRFIFNKNDVVECERMLQNGWKLERKYIKSDFDEHEVTDSSNRYGYYVMKGSLL